MSVDESQRAAIVSKLESKYEGTILQGHEIHNPDRIPFDNLELNWITGGGIPIGRWTRMFGGWSSTKTRTCYGLIAQAQAMDLSCAYYNVEKQYDKEAAISAGVDVEDLMIVEGQEIEEIGEKLEGLLTVINFHVIDSCSNAVSVDELNADLTEWRPGLMARAWGKALRRAHKQMSPTENSVVLIDQLRTQFGGKGRQASEEPPGGKFLNYLSSMNLRFRRGKWLFYDKHRELSEKGTASKTLGGSDDPDGRVINVRCEKSRVGRPELAANLYFNLNNYEFDLDWEYVKAMKFLGLAKQSGSWWTVNLNGDKSRVQGDHGLRGLIADNDKLKEMIFDAVMELD